MSSPLTKEQIYFEQRVLACGGFYKGDIDGLWGPKSEAAAQAAIKSYEMIRSEYGGLDSRSEKNIATLLPAMQRKARQLVNEAFEWGKLFCRVLSGTRTYAEQNALYAQGRTSKGNVVTNARGGSSNHNFGIAIDLGLFDGMRYLTGLPSKTVTAKQARWDSQAYVILGKHLKDRVPGIEWGGDWKSIKDTPHYEYATGLTMAQKRAKFEAGKLILK